MVKMSIFSCFHSSCQWGLRSKWQILQFHFNQCFIEDPKLHPNLNLVYFFAPESMNWNFSITWYFSEIEENFNTALIAWLFKKRLDYNIHLYMGYIILPKALLIFFIIPGIFLPCIIGDNIRNPTKTVRYK